MKKTVLPFLFLTFFSLRAFSQNCAQINFQKIISGTGDDKAYDILSTADNGFMICGTTNSVGVGAYDALLMKTDNNGNVVWSKTYGSSGNDAFRRVISTKDGNYIAVGWSQFNLAHVSDAFIMKFDPNGNEIWARSFGAGTQYGELGYGIVETDDGGFVIAGDYNANPNVVFPLYLKLDANGNLLWLDVLSANNAGEAFNVVADGNYITGAGVSAIGGVTTYNDGYMIKLLSTDGSLVWLKNIESQGRSNRVADIRLKNGQYIIDMYNADSWVGVNETPLIFKTDTSGNILYSESYEVAGINNNQIYESIYPTTDNGFIASLSETANNTAPRLAKINSSGAVDWVHNFSPYYSQYLSKVIQDPSGEFVTVGSINATSGANGDILFIKTGTDGYVKDTTGNSVCPITNSSAVNNNIPIQITDANYFTIGTGGMINIAANVIVTDFSPIVQNPCIGSNKCTTLKVIGKDSVCNTNDTIVYKANKDSTCLVPVQWSIDSTFAAIISSTDSTIQLQFKKNGTAFLHAKIISCSTLQDSLLITTFSSKDTVNLGTDISLCKDNTVTLHAGSGFQSYVWQDGSTDSILQASQPGKYFVSAQNYCGLQSSDTLIITLSPPIPFSLGPDKTKCANDTLSITAPNGFTNYSWSPAYAINRTDSQTIEIFTGIDTSYICTAQKSVGCLVSDTININILQSQPISLGNDTSFCTGDSLILNAGAGFTSYLWSTGSTSQQITVNQKGAYAIAAKGINNCISKDTLIVQNVFSIPVINIGPDTFVCKSSSYVFNAGNNFADYLWQDGSVNSTFIATQPGTYWVKVTDINHCSNADTASILGIKDLPQNFLADTAVICTGYIKQLNAIGTWVSYKWFDSTTTSFVNITSPGFYWLEVTDKNGCSAVDSIKVTAKDDCVLGIYFPNAFTPNHDGKNDVFKPIVYGYFDKFHLVIYNRWGQKIFETSDPAKGWDGTFEGKLQDSNTFVWYAQYHLSISTEKEKTAKGTVTLVR